MFSERFKAFKDGLFSKKLSILIAAILFPMVVFVLLAYVVVSGAFLIVPEKYLLVNENTDHLHVSYQVAKLHKSTSLKPQLYLLGGSSMQDSVEGTDTLQEKISTKYGLDIPVFQLSSSSQTFAESLAIVDNLPTAVGSVIVVGINYNRILGTDKSSNYNQLLGVKLLLESDALKGAIKQYEKSEMIFQTIIPGLISYVMSTMKKYIKVYLQQHSIDISNYLHQYSAKPQVDRQKALKRYKRLPLEYNENINVNIYLLCELIRVAQSKGMTVVLLETPINREYIGTELDDLTVFYKNVVDGVAREKNIHYLDFVWRTDIPDDEFIDLVHLRPGRGRKLFEETFVNEMQPILGH